MKRLILFAGYDKNSVIHDYVVYYIKELSKIADVCYMSDCDMHESELLKIMPYTKLAIARRHGKYDFGSWSELIKEIGEEKVQEYDELVFCNDSCYGPFFDLKHIFESMSIKNNDFWGITAYTKFKFPIHIQSYFIVFKSKIIKDSCLFDFMSKIKLEENAYQVIQKYEIGLTQMLLEKGFKMSTYLPLKKNISYPRSNFYSVICLKSPFLKVKVFTDSKHNLKNIKVYNFMFYIQMIFLEKKWLPYFFNKKLSKKNYISRKSKYPIKFIESHLEYLNLR